jgi:hypothetical protein
VKIRNQARRYFFRRTKKPKESKPRMARA